MRLLMALLVSLTPIHAINCSSTADCGDGETCVAGDSALSIQSCVLGAGCGGSSTGNCPSDAASGQLGCIWKASEGCGISGDGCAEVGGVYGIYQCLSIDRCDEYYGGSSCSDGCSVDGVQCSGQGACSLVSTGSDGTTTFGCSCNEGFSGEKCEAGSSSASTSSSSSTASSSRSTSSSVSSSSSRSSSTSSSTSRSSSTSSSTSQSSSISSSSSQSSSISSSSSRSSSVSGSSSFSSSVNGSLSSSSSSLSSASLEDAGNNRAGADPTSANSGSVSSQSDSGGTSSAVFIIIGILAACILVGALMFAMYSRKKKREQEAEAGGFGGAAGFAATPAESEALGGTGADTPKSSIVTM